MESIPACVPLGLHNAGHSATCSPTLFGDYLCHIIQQQHVKRRNKKGRGDGIPIMKDAQREYEGTILMVGISNLYTENLGVAGSNVRSVSTKSRSWFRYCARVAITQALGAIPKDC